MRFNSLLSNVTPRSRLKQLFIVLGLMSDSAPDVYMNGVVADLMD